MSSQKKCLYRECQTLCTQFLLFPKGEFITHHIRALGLSGSLHIGLSEKFSPPTNRGPYLVIGDGRFTSEIFKVSNIEFQKNISFQMSLAVGVGWGE